MKSKYFILILVFLALFHACNKIEEPYLENTEDVVWNGRKIMIYDFTGHRCGNCPRAHETIESLIGVYGEAIVPVAIHCTSFARVTNTDTTVPFHYDFRTEMGDFLGGRDNEIGFYGELALPIGLVNNLSADKFFNHTSWGTEIAKIISSYPEYLINIEPGISADSIIETEIMITTNVNNSRKLGLIALITEDNIIEWQTDYEHVPDKIEDYEHNHVLRAGFNGNFGEIIKNNTDLSSNGDVIIKTYSLKAGADWKISDCSIIAFVYDYDTKEVLQAEVSHITE